MHRRLTLFAFVALAACASEEATKPADPKRDALIQKHHELFAFMGLSNGAIEELCGKVAWVYDGMKNKEAKDPAAYHALAGVTKRGSPKSEAEAAAAHTKRFTMLGLTPKTQKELEDAFTAVYRDLHSPDPSEKARKIQELMKQLPPCCDDNIFERAGAAP